MDSEKPRKTLRVVRAIIFDKDSRIWRIRRGPEAILGTNKLSLPGGKVDPDVGESDEAAIHRELKEETTLTDEDIVLCSQLATIISNDVTGDDQLIETVVFAVIVTKSIDEVKLIPEGDGGKYDYDLQAIALTAPELGAPELWAFGYGHLLQLILFDSGNFPQERGTVQINEANLRTFRATLKDIRATD